MSKILINNPHPHPNSVQFGLQLSRKTFFFSICSHLYLLVWLCFSSATKQPESSMERAAVAEVGCKRACRSKSSNYRFAKAVYGLNLYNSDASLSSFSKIAQTSTVLKTFNALR